MRMVVLVTLVVGIICLFPVAFSQQETEKPPRNVILIGWDGAQRNHVKECLSRGELPNLKQLASEGALVAIDITRVTDTKAGWTQILTGYEPEITGVYSNARFQPIPRGYTIFERLEEHLGKNNFVTVAVIGKKGHVDCEGPQKVLIPKVAQGKGKKAQPAKQAQRAQRQLQRLMAMEGKVVEEKGKQYKLIPGKPYYYTRENMDVFINGLMTDERVGSKTLSLLEHYKDKPFFFFVHFAEVDHAGHKFGENSKEYNDALISADKWTGEIMKKLKELKLYDKTLIYVTADHGFDEGQTGHRDAPYVYLATNDPKVMRRGLRVDITPTILDRFGVDISKITPPLDGHPLTKPYNPPLW